jgi:hypothetical protein
VFAVLLGFGSGSYGARLGVAAARQALAALAPFALASLIEKFGLGPALWAMASVGAAGIACMAAVSLLSKT